MADKYKPAWKVSGLKIARSGYRFKASWKVPTAALNKKAENRFTDLQMRWTIDFDGKKKDIVDVDATGNERATANTQTFGEFTGNWGKWKKKKLERKAFYPYKGGKKLDGISVKVRGRHRTSDKKFHNGDWTQLVEYKFAQPRKPVITLSYDEATQVVTYTIETNAGTDNRERHDTRYRIYVKRDGMNDLSVKKWTNSTSTKIVGTYDMNGAGIVWSGGVSATITVEAFARGLWGDSSKAKKAHRVVWPSKPAIKEVSAGQTGRVAIAVEVDAKTVNVVQLQRQRNLAPGTPPDGDSWQDVEDAEDNGKCSYLYDLVSDANSTRGLYTWYRLKVTRQGFHDYSEAVRADAMFRPAASAENDEVGIISITPMENGTSAKVVVGFNEDDPNTGTEVGWSTDPNAWKSTSQPSTHKYTWKDSPAVVGYASTSDSAVVPGKTYYKRSGQGTDSDPYVYAAVAKPVSADIDLYYVRFRESATIIVAGLADGTTYYVSARRYLEGEDKETYSPWADVVAVEPAVQPSSVTLSGPGYVARGEDIELTWVFDGTAVQTGFSVHPAGAPLTSLAEGDDALGAAVITADRYGDATALELFVTVNTGGEPVDSNVVVVGIADAPALEIAVPATATAQPLSFEAYSNSASAQLSAKCVVGGESGIFEERPDGSYEQFSGDTVWADVVDPAWEASTWGGTLLRAQLEQGVSAAQDALAATQAALGGMDPADEGYGEAEVAVGDAQAALDAAQAELAAHPPEGAVYVASVEMPDGLALVDGGGYAVEATPTDTSTGLTGEPSEAAFEVGWAHQAPAPSDGISVTVDEDARTATISLAPPEGAGEFDVYDLYRGTFDGYQLIRSDLKLDDTVTDRFAAFGQRSYCVCLRTRDGDRDWDEYPYELPVAADRFDYPGGSAEMRFDLKFDESYAKRYSARAHLDGGTGGYYNPGVDRSGSYTATLVGPREDREAVNRVAAYPGACFCRTPDGRAFQCNVDIDESTALNSPLAGLSMSLRRMNLTGEFMVSASDIEEARNA